jgi:hypothetical protein
MISEIGIITPQSLQVTLKSKPGKIMRPFDLIRKIFNLSDEILKRARIVKSVSDDAG